MKKLLCISLILSGMFFLVSCSPSTPGETVKKYYHQLLSGDYENVVNTGFYFDEDMTEDEIKEEIEKMMKEYNDYVKDEVEQLVKDNGGIKNIEIESEEIDEDGERAKVRVKVIFKNDESKSDRVTVYLKNDKWMMSW